MPTNEKYCQDHKILFIKLSECALREVKCGQFCEAVIYMKTPTSKTYYIQCTTWSDRINIFKHSNGVGKSKNKRVKRFLKGGHSRVKMIFQNFRLTILIILILFVRTTGIALTFRLPSKGLYIISGFLFGDRQVY